jgi:hypothetical protein
MVNKVFISEEIEELLKSKIINEVKTNYNFNVVISFKDNTFLYFDYSYDDGDLFGWEIDFNNSTCFSENLVIFMKKNFQKIDGVPYWESGNNDLWTGEDFEVDKSLYDCLDNKVTFIRLEDMYGSN